MKSNWAVLQSAAYQPTRTIVEGALKEAAQESSELRTLLLQSAVLRQFDAALLSWLAGRREEDRTLLDDVTFFMPVEEIDENTFTYDEFTRQALLDVASSEDSEQVLTQASQSAIDYFEEKARQAKETNDIALSREYEQQALYYQLLTNPQQGFAAWQRAWAAVSGEHVDHDRQAELVRMVEETWGSLADLPGAQVEALLKKGWLAYDLDDWQSAIASFHQLLEKDSLPGVVEAETMVGLGYAHFRRGELGLAAHHFQQVTRLIGDKPPLQDRASLIRSRALCGLGEVCTRMGAPEGILLRRRLLPEQEQRKTLLEYAQASEIPPLEDLALDRLLREAEKFFVDALQAIAGQESAEGDRLRIQAQQALLYLEQGDWEGAQALFKEVRGRELARLSIDDEQSDLLAKERRIAERLARINLYLGDCCLLAAETPTLTEEDFTSEKTSFLQQQVQLKGDLLERVAQRRESRLDQQISGVSGETAEAKALTHYYTAWSLWKKINMREGMALSLRRRADVAALHPTDPVQRKEALHLYTTSLELYEQMDSPGEVARAQERIELLRALAQPEEGHPSAGEERALAKSVAAGKGAVDKGQISKKSSFWEFQEEADNVLAHRRRFFRYRIARRLERRLQYIYRVNVTLGGLVLAGLLCGWLVWLVTPQLGQISAQVTGLPWALPTLGISFLVVFMILMANRLTFIRRLTAHMIPLPWFWLDQDQVAIDDVGIHLYDHADRLKQSIRWQNVLEVRSQTWKDMPGEESGSRTAVFGASDQVIHFDDQLRGYERLRQSIKNYIAATGDPGRWQKPRKTYVKVGRFSLFLWSAVILWIAVFLACPLTLIFTLIPTLTPTGPIVFKTVGVLVALFGLWIVGQRYRESRFMHPRLGQPKSIVEKSRP